MNETEMEALARECMTENGDGTHSTDTRTILAAFKRVAAESNTPHALIRALAFLAARDGVGYRVEEIFRIAREKGWEE